HDHRAHRGRVHDQPHLRVRLLLREARPVPVRLTMTTFPPDDPAREGGPPAKDRPDEEQSSVDESIPDTPAEDQGAADAQLADETSDDAETTPLEDARSVGAEGGAAEEETGEG